MNFRRLAPGLVALIALHPATALATTAASLSGRIHLDGRLDDYAADEWILDATSAFPEHDDDSRWGNDNDVSRVAITWDDARLYLAVDFTAAATGVMVMIGSGPGGIASLDATGDFRRAIDLPFAPNLLLLATPTSDPLAARADVTHAFGLVDRATLPAVVSSSAGAAGFEAWIPWTLLDVSRPLRVVVVITGDAASGAGDAAPDSRAALSQDRYARASLDRWIMLTPDADGDGGADAGVAPRAAASVQPGTAPVAERGDAGIDIYVDPGAFAPDRGESAVFTAYCPAGPMQDVSGSCIIFAMDGRRIRTFPLSAAGPVANMKASWDGRDDGGDACDAGIYLAAFDLEFTVDGTRQQARKRGGVAVVR